jgi:hypothetical protein
MNISHTIAYKRPQTNLGYGYATISFKTSRRCLFDRHISCKNQAFTKLQQASSFSEHFNTSCIKIALSMRKQHTYHPVQPFSIILARLIDGGFPSYARRRHLRPGGIGGLAACKHRRRNYHHRFKLSIPSPVSVCRFCNMSLEISNNLSMESSNVNSRNPGL